MIKKRTVALVIFLRAAICLLIFSGCAASESGKTLTSEPESNKSAVGEAPSGQSAQFVAGLKRLNYYRAASGLQPVVTSDGLSSGAWYHARYLTKNNLSAGEVVFREGDISNGEEHPLITHSEDPKKAWYTARGADAANASFVLAGGPTGLDGAVIVDQLLSRPFVQGLILDPQLAALGYGSFCDNDRCISVVSARRGLSKVERLKLYEGDPSDLKWNPMLGDMPATPGRLRNPIEFPPHGIGIGLSSYIGGEYLDPLVPCPGYALPTGLPISLQLGEGAGPNGSINVGSFSVVHRGGEIESCLFTAAPYKMLKGKEAAIDASIAERQQAALGAATIIPKKPLEPGEYTVSIVAESKPYRWTFTVVEKETITSHNHPDASDQIDPSR